MNVVAAGFASVTDPGSLQQAYSSQMTRVRVIGCLMDYDYESASTGGMKDIDASVQLYHALEAAGMLD